MTVSKVVITDLKAVIIGEAIENMRLICFEDDV